MNKKLIGSLFLTLILVGCTPKNNEKEENEFAGRTLTIYNVADYISNGEDESVDLIAKFEEETGIKVNYYTYDTNETMYNQYKLQKEGTYDLVLASDYMVQKMAKEGLIQKFDDFETNIPNYETYGSKVLRNTLKSMEVDKDGTIINMDDYSVGYMFGTLGVIYDPEQVDPSLDNYTWDVLYNPKYKDKISIKNSMRDTFVAGLMHAYSKDEEYQNLMQAYLNAEPNSPEDIAYLNKIQEIFNFKMDGSEESANENYAKIEAVKNALIEMKQNIFGLETDSGKNDIVEGSKIIMDLAYSGDAVYSIQIAAEEGNNGEGKVLEYFVPEDGSNNWFDCWMLPNGAQKDLAYKFLDFISDPSNACDNMDYIGYTPFVVCDDLFTYVASIYGASDYCTTSTYYAEELIIYNNVLYECICEDEDGVCGELPTNTDYFESLEYDEEGEYEEGDMVSKEGLIYNCIDSTGDFDSDFEENEGYDISYLFSDVLENGRRAIIYPWLGWENCLETQYPSQKTLNRCAIMNDYGEFNAQVIIMWGQFKAYCNMTPYYVFLISFAVIVLAGSAIFIIRKKSFDKYKKVK